MILKNSRSREMLELTEAEFKQKFAREINQAFESYQRTVLAKPYFKMNKDIEGDFYFNLQWNFNHFTITNWYIERM